MKKIAEYDIVIINSDLLASNKQNIQNCIDKATAFFCDHNTSPDNALELTFFIDCNNEFTHTADEISKILNRSCLCAIPYNIIAQKPLTAVCSLEICYSFNPKYEIIRKKLNEISYTLLQNDSFKIIIVSGIGKDDVHYCCDTKDKFINIFNSVEKILNAEELNFSDIIRQWNYIENILNVSFFKNNFRQNYQVFNDVRTIYYNKSYLKNGYPSSTGIGVSQSITSIDFLAGKYSEEYLIVPLRNSFQTDAHKYSPCFLVDESIVDTKNSPKFERGKLVGTTNSGIIYISGTAAIRGEIIVGNNIEEQTVVTIDNIFNLVSDKNLNNNLENCNHLAFFNERIKKCYTYIRVYIKNTNDFAKAEKICREKFPVTPIQFVTADICRNDLLIEIEGILKYFRS